LKSSNKKAHGCNHGLEEIFMKKVRRNDKRQNRKHIKELKEKRKKEENILSRLCSRADAFFLVTLYDGQGNGITMTMDEFDALLDMEGCDV